MDSQQFRDLIIRPVLQYMGMYSEYAVELMLGTAIQESRLKYLKQMGNGPALSLFQVEPATQKDVFENFLRYRPELLQKVNRLRTDAFRDTQQELAGNLLYATAIARLVYYRTPDKIPDNLAGWADLWKRVYNTVHGKGTVSEFIENYEKYAA